MWGCLQEGTPLCNLPALSLNNDIDFLGPVIFFVWVKVLLCPPIYFVNLFTVLLQKEMLTKELERERQLRLESEQKMLQLANECGTCKEKVSALENDLKK